LRRDAPVSVDQINYVLLFQLFQTGPKFSQIEQSLAKAQQRQSKKKALISLDSLVQNEPFQWVIVTPGAKKNFCLSFPRDRFDGHGRAEAGHAG
jgi:hypothetical protein